MKDMSNEQIAMRVSINTIIVNIILSGFKLFAGIAGKSGAMVSDSVHSLSDVLSTFIVIAGVKIAGKEPDSNHQYGHERLESAAAIILSVILLLTGMGIGINSAKKILTSDETAFAIPGMIALIAAVLSVITKEGMYWYTRHAAKKINSGVLMADAWHHRSDALSSVGSFAGIFGARLGFPMLDPIAGIIICIFIAKAAVDIFLDAVRKMTDEACDDKTTSEIAAVILKQEGVLGVDSLNTRLFGDKIFVDVEICAEGSKTLTETHEIAEQVHDAIEAGFPKVKHCMVHVNPALEVSDTT